MKQPKWVETIRDNAAIELFELAQSKGIDTPQPLCRWCRGPKRMTAYGKIEFSNDPEIEMFWKNTPLAVMLLGSQFFKMDGYIYTVINSCPDCLGFNDGWEGKTTSVPKDYSPSESAMYFQAHARGMRNREKEANKDKEESKASKIKREIGLT